MACWEESLERTGEANKSSLFCIWIGRAERTVVEWLEEFFFP